MPGSQPQKLRGKCWAAAASGLCTWDNAPAGWLSKGAVCTGSSSSAWEELGHSKRSLRLEHPVLGSADLEEDLGHP